MRRKRRRAPRAMLISTLLTLVVAGALLFVFRDHLPLPAAGTSSIERQRGVTTLELDMPAAGDDAMTAPLVSATRIVKPAAPVDPTLADTPVIPPDMPVPELLALLGDRARAGDAVAACELGRALNECRMQSIVRRMPTRPAPPSDAAGKDVESFVNAEAAREEWQERLAQRCDGLAPGEIAQGVGHQARAALAGHVPSLVDFINAPMTSPAEFIRDPQLGQLYRTQVWPMLRRALAAGDFQAANMMMIQLGMGQMSPLSAVIPATYQDADAARAMMVLLGSPMPMPLQSAAAPSPEAIETAQRWVDELFGGRLPQGNPRPSPFASPMRSDSRCRESNAWVGADGR
jgi:hypothetical protein